MNSGAGQILTGGGLVRLDRRRLLAGLAGLALAPGTSAFGGQAPIPPRAGRVERVLVEKSSRRLLLYGGGAILAEYPIALGGRPVGPKRRLGDGRTPEGNYVIDGRNDRSPYHLALHVSYPDADDIARADAAGVDPGGDICVHGLPAGFERLDPAAFTTDWTEGCIAVSDRAIEAIWSRVADGTPIDIRA